MTHRAAGGVHTHHDSRRNTGGRTVIHCYERHDLLIHLLINVFPTWRCDAIKMACLRCSSGRHTTSGPFQKGHSTHMNGGINEFQSIDIASPTYLSPYLKTGGGVSTARYPPQGDYT